MPELELNLEQEIAMCERRLSELKQRAYDESQLRQKDALKRIVSYAQEWAFETVEFNNDRKEFYARCRYIYDMTLRARGEVFALELGSLSEQEVKKVLDFMATLEES